MVLKWIPSTRTGLRVTFRQWDLGCTVAIAAASILTLSSSAHAERWQTTEGFLSVEKPNEDTYETARPRFAATTRPVAIARWFDGICG